MSEELRRAKLQPLADAINEQRALTQRPAAQTLSHDETHDWSDRIAKLQRPASLPAPQQATPDHFPEAKEMVPDQNTIKKATPEPSRGMIGMGAHALAIELAQAVAQDDADPEEHDMSAGLFGPNVSAWLRKVAAEYLSRPATPEPVGEPFGWWFTEDPEVFSMPGSGFRRYPNKPQHTVECIPLFTRPAPGVPEVK